MTSEIQNTNDKKIYDLEERTALLGEKIIDFAKTLPHDRISDELVKQFIRSWTSIGANYMEADGAESKKDFRHKISLCKKEAKETKHWIRMIAKANPDRKMECKNLWQEAQELTLIFSTIINTSRKGNRK
jgi:four helix bundle protein